MMKSPSLENKENPIQFQSVRKVQGQPRRDGKKHAIDNSSQKKMEMKGVKKHLKKSP